jgi:hypothetical protein
MGFQWSKEGREREEEIGRMSRGIESRKGGRGGEGGHAVVERLNKKRCSFWVRRNS